MQSRRQIINKVKAFSQANNLKVGSKFNVGTRSFWVNELKALKNTLKKNKVKEARIKRRTKIIKQVQTLQRKLKKDVSPGNKGSEKRWINRLVQLKKEQILAKREKLRISAEKALKRSKLRIAREKLRNLVIIEAARVAKLKLQKLYNVHIVAEYNFGRRNRSVLDNINIDFSTRDFTRGAIRRRIDELRVAWEEDNNNIIAGKTNWVFIRYISTNIVEVQRGQLAAIPMLKTKWNYKLLGDIDKININPGQCVPDYLLYEFSKCRTGNFKSMTKDKIIKLLGGKKKGYTTADIITLAETSNYISVNALSPMLEVFEHHKAKIHTRINLCFIVNNNHCYPILHKTFKDQIIYKKYLDLGQLKFDVSYDDHEYYESEKHFLDKNKPVTIQNYKKQNLRKVCLIESSNLSELARKVMDQTKDIIQGMKFYYHVLTSFEHPNGHIVEAAKGYHLRKTVCEYLHKEFPIKEFIFSNQTWNTMSRNLFKYGFDDMIQSKLSSKLEEIFDTYPVSPYMKKLVDVKYSPRTCIGFDICKSYTDVLLNNKDVFPIFTVLDQVKPINDISEWLPGEYFINKTIKMANNTIVLDKGFYPLNITRYALEKNYININNITHFIRATTHLKANHFVPFVNYCFDIDVSNLRDDNESISKSLVNFFTGYLNKKYHILEKGCITDSYEMACGTFIEENKKGNDCFINKVSDLYIIRSTKKKKILETSSPIWRHIICGGIMNLDKMHKRLCDENSTIASYKVDAIMIMNPKKNYEKEIKDDNNKTIGDIIRESWSVSGTSINIDDRPQYIHKVKTWVEKSYDHSSEMFNELKEGSYLINGISGSGKSYLLSRLIKSQPNRKSKVLCFTNKAVSILRKKGIKNVSTFDSVFYNKNTGKKDLKLGLCILNKYDNIYSDEYGMNSCIYMDLLNMLKKEGKNIRLFGDDNQCSPIEKYSAPRSYDYDDEGIRIGGLNTYKLYDYKETDFMKSMCDCRYYNMDYLPQYGRYDEKLYEVVSDLLVHDKLSLLCKNKVLIDCMVNIAYTNKKCEQINNKCITKFKNTHKGTLITCSDSQVTKQWQEEMPVICNINSWKNKTNRSQQFIIDKIDKKKKIIKLKGNDAEFDYKYFTDNFNHGFCITVHRMQGDEIQEAYNIHEIWMMSKELLYTAIGRGTLFNNVNFEYNSKIFRKERIFKGSVQIKAEPLKITKEMEDSNNDKQLRNNDKQSKKPEPIIQIIEDVYLNKSRQKFNIVEGKDSYTIQYREDGKKKKRRVNFGKKTTKKQALKKITEIKRRLIS